MTATAIDYGQIAALQGQLQVKAVELWEANCGKNAAIADAQQARVERDAATFERDTVIAARDALADELRTLRATHDAIAQLTSPGS